MPKDLKGGKQTDLDGHDDIVELKNREEALIAAEARFTELNGRIEVGLVKMDRMFALMEQLVKPMQSVKQESKIGSTPTFDLSPNRPEIKRTLHFSTNKKPPPPPPIPNNEVLGLVKEKFAKESIIRTANSTVQLSTTNGEFFVAKFMDYLESLGLKQAVLATRAQYIDPENNKETEKANISRINILRNHKKAAWAEAHLQLKSLLTAEMYKELVINKDKEGKQDFFDLWDLCLQKTGNKRTCDTMMMKRDQFDQLKLEKGSFFSSFLSNLEALADDVNRLGGSQHITNFEKNRKLHKQAIRYTRFKNVCDMVLPNIDSATWSEFSQRFDPYKPKGKNGEEIALGEPDGENDGEERTELANAATNHNRSSRETSCSFCKRRGHTVEECRTKKYSGFSVPNKNCKQWVMNGRCTWETQTGKPCKFEHNPQTRNTKTWEANFKRSEQKAVDTTSNAATTTDVKADSAEFKESAHGVTTDSDGLLGLVEDLPSSWSHHVHHNRFGVLAEKGEEAEQQTSAKENEKEAEQENQQPPTKEEETTTQPAMEIGIEPVMAQPTPPTGIEPVWWLLAFMGLLWRKLFWCWSKKEKKKKKKKKRAQEAQVMHTSTSKQKSMILIDSACSKSNHPNEQGLQKITTKLVRMFTANRSSTLSTKEGTLMIEGLPVRVSVVPTFDKTLVSLGELDKMGITWTGGNGKWALYHPDGTVWTTLQLGKDNLYHFTAAEQQQDQQQEQ